jgi:hypothetical protein
MPEHSGRDDADIIHAAYAERVREAFKIFADNLGVGENEKLCRDRFLRALLIVRRARDLAVQAAAGEAAQPVPDATARSKEAAGAGEEISAGALSAEDQALVDKALAGTTGIGANRPRR